MPAITSFAHYYSNLFAVVAGTTCGMLVANAPVIFLGNAFAGRLPMRALHYTTSAARPDRFDEILYLVDKSSDLTLPDFGRGHPSIRRDESRLHL